MNEREQVVADKMGRCVHFTGLWAPGMRENKTCKAGVVYEDVHPTHDPIEYKGRRFEQGRTFTATRSLPCVDSLNHCGVVCDKRVAVTREQAEAEEAEFQERFRFWGEARKAVIAATGNKGGSGIVPCPKCGGKLHYGQASTNKHVHARCETEGCLAWME